jgi:hypothetical protein
MLMFLRCLGEALMAQGMRGLLGIVPFGEQVYEVAANAIDRYRELRREKHLAADIQEVVQADPEQVRAQAHQIAQEVASGQPEIELRQIEAYTSPRSQALPVSRCVGHRTWAGRRCRPR